MFLRTELHNHSTQSDGELTVDELVKYAAEKKFGVLALTDHNTVSGHNHAYEAILRGGHALSLLPGVEFTTFFGHVLALGLTQMIDFTWLNPKRPELFFDALRSAGARAVGIAHPFSIGSPLLIGCRFEMEVQDWSSVDYIEVANTSISESKLSSENPITEILSGNEQALAFWESLVLSGYKIAAVTGKDIHSRPTDASVFTTYVQVEDNPTLPAADAILAGILTQKTIVTKGPLFETCLEGRTLTVIFDSSSDYLGWNAAYSGHIFCLELKDSTGNVQYADTDLTTPLSLVLSPDAISALVKLYEGSCDCDYEHLIAVGSPVYIRR
jgi:hypothetical protein